MNQLAFVFNDTIFFLINNIDQLAELFNEQPDAIIKKIFLDARLCLCLLRQGCSPPAPRMQQKKQIFAGKKINTEKRLQVLLFLILCFVRKAILIEMKIESSARAMSCEL